MTTLPKATLLAVVNALKRAFASALALDLARDELGAPGLVVALFQSRAYFEPVRDRYEAFAAAGATVLVGFPGAGDDLPLNVVGIDITGREELADSWSLVVCCGALTATLVAVDRHELTNTSGSLEAARAFSLRLTVRRDALDAARQLLRPLRPRLSTRTLALCEAALRRSEDAEVSEGEDLLATAFEQLVKGFGRADRLRREQPDAADVDLLTGLYNRRFLSRYLIDAGQSATKVIAVLADVDDLGKINDIHGSDVGDRVLVHIANAIVDEGQPGDIVVRIGDDEFLVVRPASDQEGPLVLAERVRCAVAATRFPAPYESLCVTVSVGTTITDLEGVLDDRLADAVRLSKLLGKNVARLAN